MRISIRATCAKLSTAIVLLIGTIAMGQNGNDRAISLVPKTGVPRLRQTFSREAIKTLLTIQGTRDSSLVDSAMINVSAAQSTQAELTVVWHIQLFQQIYAINEAAGKHDDNHRCIVAWIPKLRSLSGEIPKQCPRLTADEIRSMSKR